MYREEKEPTKHGCRMVITTGKIRLDLIKTSGQAIELSIGMPSVPNNLLGLTSSPTASKYTALSHDTVTKWPLEKS